MNLVRAHVPNHSRITAAIDCVFHSEVTIPTPTVCDSVSWVVEVSKGYQSVHIYTVYVCANEGLL